MISVDAAISSVRIPVWPYSNEVAECVALSLHMRGAHLTRH